MDAAVFAVEVVTPVGVEVAVADQGTEFQDGLGSGQAPAGAGDLQAVADQVAAGSFDDPGGDGPARGQRLVVAQELVLAGEIADAGVGAGPLGGGQACGLGFRGDLGGGPGAVAGQDRECLDRDPVLGCGVAWRVQGTTRLSRCIRVRG